MTERTGGGTSQMPEDRHVYKSLRLRIYQLGVGCVNRIYTLAHLIRTRRGLNLRSQLERAANLLF
jgi:hypothetical protein